MKLLPWVDIEKLDWKILSSNRNAISLLERNLDKINWEELSGNPNAIHLLEANQDKIDWKKLANNTNAIHLLEQNAEKVEFWDLLWNYNAHLLLSNPDTITRMLTNYSNELCIHHFCGHPAFIKLVEIMDKERIDWSDLSKNRDAIHLLEQNQDKIDWRELSKNPSIFEEFEYVLK